MLRETLRCASVLFALLCVLGHAPAGAEELPVEDITRDTPVDFATEIYPILKQNCIACHHAKESEGGLNLESHEKLLAGGDSGAAVVAKDLAKSLIFARANGSLDELMPPPDNSVGAKPLTALQLGLIKQWINEGAPGGEVTQTQSIAWQPIPESVRATYAVDVSADGQLIAAGHGNRVVLYDLASAAEVARLVDPSLQDTSGPVADVDLIQSIAFSPSGNRLATGGYRSVRIWRRDLQTIQSPLTTAAGIVAVKTDGKFALVNAIGDIEIWNQENRVATLTGHSDSITGLAWATAADRLVSCDRGGKVIVWDTTTGKSLVSEQLAVSPQRLAISSDADAVGVVDTQRRVVMLRVEAENLVKTDLAAATPIADANDVVFARSKQLIVATDRGGMVIDLANGNQIRKINHGGAVDAVNVNAESTQLATAGRDGHAKIWRIDNGEAVTTMTGSPQSQLLLASAQRDANRQKAAVTRLTAAIAVLEKAVTSEDEAIKKIKEQKEKATTKLAEDEKKRVAAVALVAATQATITKATADSTKSQQATMAGNQTLTAATALTEKLKQEIAVKKAAMEKAKQDALAKKQAADAAQQALTAAKAAEAKLVQEVAAKQAEITKAEATVAKAKTEIEAAKKLAATSKALLDKSNKEIATQKTALTKAEETKAKSETDLATRNQALATATAAQARAVAAVPAQKLIVEAASRRATVLDQKLASVQTQATAPGNSAVDVAFSANGKHVAVATAGHQTRIYRATDGLPLRSLTNPDSTSMTQVVFHGNTLCSFSATGQSVVWPLSPTWRLERTIGNPDESPISDRVTAIDFRDDGRSIAVGSGPPSRLGDVKIFSVDSGELLRDFGDVHSDTVLGLRFAPDGRTLASSAADKTVRLLDVTANQVIRSFEGHTHHVLAVDWQDDGQTIASASADQNIKVWNAETGEQRKTIAGFSKEITAIAFVQQTSQVVTACADGQVRLHDALNGRSLRTFNAQGDFLYSVAVTRDGKTIVAGGQSGVLRVWNLADGKLLHEVK